MDNAALVLTDSGGIQEETTILGVPCLTFRENTERPITVSEGTNQLIGLDLVRLATAVDEVLSGEIVDGRTPELWDGQAAARILHVLRNHGARHSPASAKTANENSARENYYPKMQSFYLSSADSVGHILQRIACLDNNMSFL